VARANEDAALLRHDREDVAGLHDVLGLGVARDGARTVRARSAAEMPVPTSREASMETVKLVPSGERLSFTMSGRFNCRQRSSVSVRQMRPRAWVAMKLIASGRHEIGGEHEIALVLAILGVGEDDHAPEAQVVDQLTGGVGHLRNTDEMRPRRPCGRVP
jgi:hypothetical protein